MNFPKLLKQAVYHHIDLKGYPLIFDTPYLMDIDTLECKLQLYLHLKSDSKTLLVLCPSAIGLNNSDIPTFHRWSWSDSFSDNVIVLPDPTVLKRDLSIGWMLGWDDFDPLVKFTEILKRLISDLDIKQDKIIFYGTSAGGFSAIKLASMLKSSKAIVQNPQTDVSLYEGMHYKNLIKSNFNNEDLPQYKKNLISWFKKIAYIPNIYYIQNVADGHHFKQHFKPFMEELNALPLSEDARIIYDVYSDKSSSHNPDSKELALNRIKAARDLLYLD